MLDLLIRGGTVVDGTGGPRRRADVGVRDGRIVAVGTTAEDARRTIDADGLVVAPGVIDLHTHYDAQLCWDPYATPSPLHGVTTVIGGNCGLSLAPATADDVDYVTRLLSRVEGIPLETLQAGVPWNWQSFGQYLDAFEGRLGVNAGFMVGHSVLRRRVLGADLHRAASDDEIAAMRGLLEESLVAGGLGYATSVSPFEHDGDGRPMPSRAASRHEHLVLSTATGTHPGTMLQIAPNTGEFTDDTIELMISMSLAADRPLNWNVIFVSQQSRASTEQRLAISDRAVGEGACLVGLAVPIPSALQINFVSGFMFDALPVFEELMQLGLAERREVLASPGGRNLLRRGADSTIGRALWYVSDWASLGVVKTYSAANDGLAGRTIGDIARERGIDPFDCLCDVVVADDLRTSLTTVVRGADDESWKLRQGFLHDPRTLAGGSDSGAHLDMIDTFLLSTDLLGPSVRDRGLFTLEEAVHLLTGAPARYAGLVDRGTVAEGAWADLFVFDPETLAPGPVDVRTDLPAGGSRIYGEAAGVHHVFVNGGEVVGPDGLTDALPGAVLRSGRDTATVTNATALAAGYGRTASS